MENSNQFKLTYYVGVMLAQGGVLQLYADRMIFSPRALERAVGAQDTVILYSDIKSVEVTGTITESLMIRTAEKAHRFVGGEPYKIRDRINQVVAYFQSQSDHNAMPTTSGVAAQPAALMPELAVSAPKEKSSAPAIGSSAQGVCPRCQEKIRIEYFFCPACGFGLRPNCRQCHRSLEPTWKFCAACGSTAK